MPGLLTGLASAVAFNVFHIPPTGGISIADSSHWVALGVYLVTAAIASRVADVARTRAAEAERRRGEADLAADTARVLLGGATLADALPAAGELIGTALGLRGVQLTLDPAADDDPPSVALDLGAGRRATLVLGPAPTPRCWRASESGSSRRSKRCCGRRSSATSCRRPSWRRRRCAART